MFYALIQKNKQQLHIQREEKLREKNDKYRNKIITTISRKNV